MATTILLTGTINKPRFNNLPASPKPSDYFSTWSESLPNQDAQGNLFDRAIQGASASGVGSMTDTYKDDSGRTVETLFDDGSFTQTAYSPGDAAVTSIPAPLGWIAALGGATATTLTPPAGLTIPVGGSETVSVARRKLGDAAVLTYDVYHAADLFLHILRQFGDLRADECSEHALHCITPTADRALWNTPGGTYHHGVPTPPVNSSPLQRYPRLSPNRP